MSSSIFYLFVALLATVIADDVVTIDGKCPHINAVENYNISAYAGKWYEISKYPNTDESKGKCASAEYTPNGEVVKVKNAHVIDGVQNFIEGSAKLADDANGSGKLQVTFKFGDVERVSSLLILATNYNGYALAYSCRYDESQNKSKVYAWVLSRSKTLEGESKTALDAALKAANLDASKLITSDQSDEACKYSKTVEITKHNA